MNRRWDVEVSRNEFQDVGAAHARIEGGGALGFYDQRGVLLVGYAPGEWKTVSLGEDEEETP